MEIKNKLFIFIVILLFFSPGFGPLVPHWQKLISLPSESRVYSIFNSTNKVILGADNGIYIMENDQLVRIPYGASGLSLIRDLALSPDGNIIYVATDNGVYSFDRTKASWNRIFTSSDELERQCNSILVGDYIVLGTSAGIFYKGINDKEWQGIRGELARARIEALTWQGHNIYAATPNALYRYSLQTRSYKKIFILEASTNEAEENGNDRIIKSLHAFMGVIYVGSARGVFLSKDEGETWQRVALPSVPVDEIVVLLPVEKNVSNLERCPQDHENCIDLFIATYRGAFLYSQGKVTSLYQGMETNEINELSLGLHGEVLAGTNAGLYALRFEETLPNLARAVNYEQFRRQFKTEPTIKDVHLMAIDYAEVQPQKIADWRRMAKFKAALPSVSTGINRSATDRYHWDTGQNPDFLQEGKEFLDWDISLSWDLSDLIWSADQTTIDSRSKLMVELREDIIDQVTRLYFERRRLQIELLAFNGESQDPIEKQLRLEELTALIDGYTGGSFSKAMINESKGDGSDGNARN